MSRAVPLRRLLSAAALLTIAVPTLAPTAPASASSGPVVVNPSLEEDRDGNGVPDGWRRDAWGTHKGRWALTSDAHTGARAQYVEVWSHKSGDRKLLAASGAAPDVQPGARYELGVWYKANTTVSFVVFTRDTSGAWRYWTAGPAQPAIHSWTQATFTTPAVPAGTVEIAHGLALGRNGIVKTDDYSIRTVDDNPFSGTELYVDPYSNAAKEAAALRDTDPTRAALFDRIASRSQADWFGDWNPTSELRTTVASRAATIRTAGALPVFVTYAIPARDCGGYSAGGTNSPDAYRAWIDQFAAGVSGGSAVVVVEPDALAQLDCLTSSGRTDRLALLRYAVDTLRTAGATVYLDAGHSAWIPVDVMAERLRSAGVEAARGVSLNVSNFRWTDDEAAYARSLSQALGGTVRAVIDTSRNGQGPTDDGQWCNPDGRGLGPAPGRVDDPVVDAYLWVKRPGESDGTCNGGPTAGTWWPTYAEGLAARAAG